MNKRTELPPTWAMATLGDIGTWCGGGTPDKSNSLFWTEGTVPWVSPKDMKTLHIRDSEDHISENATELTNVKRFPAGTVLVVVRSGILSRTLPVAVSDVTATMNQDLKGIVPHEGIDSAYVAYFLMGHERLVLHQCCKNGTTVASIEVPRLKAFPIRLAPLAEQRRVVAKIEELFSDLDAGVAALERAKANLKRYRAAVLKAAVEGKLTEVWRAEHPQTEPASKLLDRILAERRRKWEADQLAKYAAAGKEPPKNWKDKYVEPTPPDTTGLPELPEGWCWATWEHLLATGEGAFKRGPFGSALTKSLFVSSGYKVYEQYCPINDDCSFARYYITDAKYREMESFAVQAGDYLISCSGVTLGRITQVPQEFEPGIINQALLRVRINSNVMRCGYFLRLFRSPFFQRQIFENSTGSAIPNVRGVKELKAIRIPLPPIEEQDHLAFEIDETLSQIAAAESEIGHSLRRAARLRQSILKQAFQGKLVPQDPNDEPGSALLERLRTNRPVHEGNGQHPARPRGRRAKAEREEGRADE